MLKNLFFCSFLAIATFSCKKDETVLPEPTKAQPQKFTIDSVKISDSMTVADSLTLVYNNKFLYFPTLKNETLLDSIYFLYPQLTDFSKVGLQNFLNTKKDQFFSQFNNEKKSWVESVSFKQTWYDKNEMKIISNTNDYMHIQYAGSSFMGGAHNNYYFSERVFDLKNNKRTVLTDITTMPDEKLSEILFKNLNKMPTGANSGTEEVKNSDMLLVDKIPVTDNFYFDEKNLYFHYSPYEIAAFAAGDITIPIPWTDLAGTLNEEFKSRNGL